MDAFDQMYEIVTAFNDDGFKSKIKDVGEKQKALKAAQKAHDEREADLKTRESKAKVVLNSQETFNSQHKTRMTVLQAAEDSLQSKKDAFKAEQDASKDDLKTEEDRLKDWSADLTRDQNEADVILKTREKTAKDAEKAKANRTLWETKVEQLGLKVA